jgi:hypothetical protein
MNKGMISAVAGVAMALTAQSANAFEGELTIEEGCQEIHEGIKAMHGSLAGIQASKLMTPPPIPYARDPRAYLTVQLTGLAAKAAGLNAVHFSMPSNGALVEDDKGAKAFYPRSHHSIPMERSGDLIKAFPETIIPRCTSVHAQKAFEISCDGDQVSLSVPLDLNNKPYAKNFEPRVNYTIGVCRGSVIPAGPKHQ